MAFPVTNELAKDLGTAIELAASIKNVLQEAKKGLAVGTITADDLMLFVVSMKKYFDPLVAVQGRLGLGTSSGGGLAEDINTLVLSIGVMLLWIGTNLPKQGEYLLTHSIDENFNLVPRVFSGAIVASFNARVDLILQELQ